jgi:hypothetical protein
MPPEAFDAFALQPSRSMSSAVFYQNNAVENAFAISRKRLWQFF